MPFAIHVCNMVHLSHQNLACIIYVCPACSVKVSHLQDVNIIRPPNKGHIYKYAFSTLNFLDHPTLFVSCFHLTCTSFWHVSRVYWGLIQILESLPPHGHHPFYGVQLIEDCIRYTGHSTVLRVNVDTRLFVIWLFVTRMRWPINPQPSLSFVSTTHSQYGRCSLNNCTAWYCVLFTYETSAPTCWDCVWRKAAHHNTTFHLIHTPMREYEYTNMYICRYICIICTYSMTTNET